MATPTISPKSTSTMMVAKNVVIQTHMSKMDLEASLGKSWNWRNIDRRETKMMAERTAWKKGHKLRAKINWQNTLLSNLFTFGNGSNNGPMKSKTQSRMNTDTTVVMRVLQPELSWTADRDKEVEIGNAEKKLPKMLLEPRVRKWCYYLPI